MSQKLCWNYFSFSWTWLVEVDARQCNIQRENWLGLEFHLQFMQCRQEATYCLPALKPRHYLSILGKGKIAPALLLPRVAKQKLLSSFRSGKRRRSMNLEWAQELELLLWNRSRIQKSDYDHLWCALIQPHTCACNMCIISSFVIKCQFMPIDHNGSHKPVSVLSSSSCTYHSQNERFLEYFMCILNSCAA